MSRRGEVDIVPLREAFERSGLTITQVAVRLGWTRANGSADGTRVAKTLGIAPTYSHGYRYFQQTTSYELGVALCRALEAWPVDVGV